MLPGKNQNYKGPKTHHAIIKKILVEGKRKRQYSLTLYEIEKIIRLFFNPRHGITRYFKTGNNFLVKGVGSFIPNKARRYRSIIDKVKRKLAKRARTIMYWQKYYERQAKK